MNVITALFICIGIFFAVRWVSQLALLVAVSNNPNATNKDDMSHRLGLDGLISSVSWSLVWLMTHQ